MDIIQIDFTTLSYVAIGLFALVGFTRGWFREAFTTILLMFMVLLISQPELAAKLAETLNVLLAALITPLLGGEAGEGEGLFDINNPYGFMLFLTGFLILISYTFGKRALSDAKIAPLSRLLGGLLGAVNAFIVLSLVQQYLLTLLGITAARSGGPAGVQSAAARPQTIPMQIEGLAAPFAMSGVTLALILALGFVVLVFFMREMRTRGLGRKAAKSKAG
jgi:hypothetical protein